jgi:hypothetical protein
VVACEIRTHEGGRKGSERRRRKPSGKETEGRRREGRAASVKKVYSCRRTAPSPRADIL